jgi:hypothetical protein
MERAGGGREHVEVLYRYWSRHDYGSRFAGLWHDLASFFLARTLEIVVCFTMIRTEGIPDQSSEIRREDIGLTTSTHGHCPGFSEIATNNDLVGRPRSYDDVCPRFTPRHQASVSHSHRQTSASQTTFTALSSIWGKDQSNHTRCHLSYSLGAESQRWYRHRT